MVSFLQQDLLNDTFSVVQVPQHPLVLTFVDSCSCTILIIFVSSVAFGGVVLPFIVAEQHITVDVVGLILVEHRALAGHKHTLIALLKQSQLLVGRTALSDASREGFPTGRDFVDSPAVSLQTHLLVFAVLEGGRGPSKLQVGFRRRRGNADGAILEHC